MPLPSTLALFAAAALALACTPGPDMLLIVSRSAAQGRGAGFATLFGVQTGVYGHAAAVALGLAELFRAVPVAYDAVRYTGAAYLLVLAWSAFRSKGAVAAAGDAPRVSLGAAYRQGLFTNLLNPKVALFALALFPQFVAPEAGPVALQILVLATVLNAVGLLVNGALVLGASRLGHIATGRGRFRRAPGMALGTVFAGLALRLAMDGGR